MSTESYVVDILLIALVLRQLRVRPLTPRSALLPLALIAWAWIEFFQGFSPNRADVVLIIAFVVVGAALGTLSGTSTRVWSRDGQLVCQAGVVAAASWIVGMGFRLVFEIWSNSTSGTRWIERFSIDHDINSAGAWITALLLMAVAQVVLRVGILQWRRLRVERASSRADVAVPDLEMD